MLFYSIYFFKNIVLLNPSRTLKKKYLFFFKQLHELIHILRSHGQVALSANWPEIIYRSFASFVLGDHMATVELDLSDINVLTAKT